jgi:hypothetical protein
LGAQRRNLGAAEPTLAATRLLRRFALRNAGMGWVISTAHLRPPSLRRQFLPRGAFDLRRTHLGNHDRRALALVEVTAGITEASMTPALRDRARATRCRRRSSGANPSSRCSSRDSRCRHSAARGRALTHELETAVQNSRSWQPVGPSLGTVQYRDDLNDVAVHPIGYYIGCARDDEFACVGHATRAAKSRRCRQASHRRPNSFDHTARRGRVVSGNIVANVFEPAKIAGSIFEATRRHRGCNSR